MESQKAKIVLYAKRTFGEKMNASFDFIKENWKPLFKFTTYILLPLCLVQALSLNGLMGSTMSLSSNIQAGSSNPFAIFGAMFWVFTELLEKAGLESPFEEKCLREVCASAEGWLKGYDLTGLL